MRRVLYYNVIKHDGNLRTRGKCRKPQPHIDFIRAKNKTRFSQVLYSDKTWVFDQSERANCPVFIINKRQLPFGAKIYKQQPPFCAKLCSDICPRTLSVKTVRFSEEIMPADKYPRTFLRQMEAIVYIILRIYLEFRSEACSCRPELTYFAEKMF